MTDHHWTQIDAYHDHENSGRAGTQRMRVLLYLTQCGARGATDNEGIDATGMPPRQYTTRRKELVDSRVVENTGDHRDGPTGNPNIVWRFNPNAQAVPNPRLARIRELEAEVSRLREYVRDLEKRCGIITW